MKPLVRLGFSVSVSDDESVETLGIGVVVSNEASISTSIFDSSPLDIEELSEILEQSHLL